MRVYLDSCAIIEALEKSTPIASVLLRFLDASRSGSPYVVTSELTLSEILVHPFREGDLDLAGNYERIISATEQLDVVPVSRRILIKAAELRAAGRCAKLPDAIHVAAAAEAGCDVLVTDDVRVRLPPPMRLVRYREHELLALLSGSP